MKTQLTFTLALLISLCSFAQSGINYKAVIKDGGGNIVANQAIVIGFEIEDESVVLYEESHSPTTDANGIIVVTVGEGSTIFGEFDDIEWGADNHYLNVKVDIGGGFVSMGGSQFKYVPYAKTADIAKSIENPVWLRNGSMISYNDGLVGIGIANPTNLFSILQPITSSENVVRFQSMNHPAGKDLLELIIPFDASPNSQFIEMQYGVDIVAAINGDGSAKFKSVQFEDNSVQTKAAIGPKAFGFVDDNGDITYGSGNITAVWNAGSSRYEITISGLAYTFSNNVTIVTPSGHIYRTRVSSNAGNLLVYLHNSSDALVQGRFQFITY